MKHLSPAHLLLALSFIASGCAPQGSHDSTITFGDSPSSSRRRLKPSLVLTGSANSLVTNGSAYEFGSLAIPSSVHELVVPEEIVVRPESIPGLLKTYSKKTLTYMGHPGKRMSIAQSRDEMGLATKQAGSTLELISYGAWSSKEGGADVQAVLFVPKDLLIRRVPAKHEVPDRAQLIIEGWQLIDTLPDNSQGLEQYAGTPQG